MFIVNPHIFPPVLLHTLFSGYCTHYTLVSLWTAVSIITVFRVYVVSCHFPFPDHDTRMSVVTFEFESILGYSDPNKTLVMHIPSHSGLYKLVCMYSGEARCFFREVE